MGCSVLPATETVEDRRICIVIMRSTGVLVKHYWRLQLKAKCNANMG